MQFDQHASTMLDLNFRFFRVPVRVHPFFWLSAVLLGWDLLAPPGGFEVLLLWIACMFVSILLHELGHVWMGHIFGSRGSILLQGFGGLAIGATGRNRWERIAVCLAGPAIQLAFAALLFAGLFYYDQVWAKPEHVAVRKATLEAVSDKIDFVQYFTLYLEFLSAQPTWHRLVQYAVQFLISINLWWAIINLLPVWPLDGGQVSRELFVWRNRITGTRNALALSLAAALMLTINAISGRMDGPRVPYLPSGGLLFVGLFGILAFNSYMNLQMEAARAQSGWRDPEDEDRMPWERDPDEWKRG